MSLTKTRAFLKWWAENAQGAPAGADAARALVEAEKAAKALRAARGSDRAKRLLREMFRDGQLDAYPTSDEAPEYALKKWCDYENEERDT